MPKASKSCKDAVVFYLAIISESVALENSLQYASKALTPGFSFTRKTGGLLVSPISKPTTAKQNKVQSPKQQKGTSLFTIQFQFCEQKKV
jgi:hypothetical protein